MGQVASHPERVFCRGFQGLNPTIISRKKMPEVDVFVRLCGPCQIDHTTSIRKHVGVEGLHGREIGF